MHTPELPGKRLLVGVDQEQVNKKAKYSHDDAGKTLSDESISNPLPSQPRIQYEPTAAAEPVATHLGLPLMCLDDTDEDDYVHHREAPITPSWNTTARDPVTPNAATPAVERSRATTPVGAYDACFGLLCVQATCAVDAIVPAECTPVRLEFDRKLLRVYLEGSTDRIAVVVSDTLSRLVSRFAVTLTATICGKTQKLFADIDIGKQNTAKMPGVKFCSLRIIVYGLLPQKDEVADILVKGHMFLQHPGETEFDKTVKYLNPQYLLPPGEDMPPMEKLSIYTCCAGQEARQGPSRDALGEYEKTQIFKIFDTAYESDGVMATIKPSPRLVTEVKRHQIEALAMMVEKELGIYEHAHFPAIWVCPSGHSRYQNIVTEKFEMSAPPPMGGGILADEMGLGKTLSSLSLICNSLDRMDQHPELSHTLPRATLVVTPKSTIYGWEKQIITHIHSDKIRWITYHGPKRREVSRDIALYDIVLTTYDTLRSDRGKGALFDQKWARVILDEAHKIRNPSSIIFKDVCKITAEFRWCLTGTPIQNYLDDFGALLAFIRVPPFDSKDSFYQYIVGPIKTRKNKSLQLLRKVVAATCLRRTKADHASALNLPQKVERVEEVEMDHSDRRLYEFFKRFSYLTAGADKASKKKAATNILVLISMLRLICDHGEGLLPESALNAWKRRDEKALTWEMLESGIRRCISCDRQIEELGTAESVTEGSRCGHVFCESCATKSQISDSQPVCPKCGIAVLMSPLTGGGCSPFSCQTEIETSSKPRYPSSAKVKALVRNILEKHKTSGNEKQPAKSVIFSYWTKMLDFISAALRDKGLSFCRIDGQSSMSQRKKALEKFGSDPGCNIMLASIGAAGEGIDLTAANSVHIVEPHWNPMAEAQAVDRVHRIGQLQDVEVVRYIVNDSIELYVRWVQMHKLKLIKESLSPSDLKSQNVAEVRWKKLLEYLE